MSTVTVNPGDDITINPNEQRVVLADFDQVNLPVGVTLSSPIVTIAAIKQSLTALTADNVGLLAGNRKIQARFLGTTATNGDRYLVRFRGTTSESPSQTKEYSITISIETKK